MLPAGNELCSLSRKLLGETGMYMMAHGSPHEQQEAPPCSVARLPVVLCICWTADLLAAHLRVAGCPSTGTGGDHPHRKASTRDIVGAYPGGGASACVEPAPRSGVRSSGSRTRSATSGCVVTVTCPSPMHAALPTSLLLLLSALSEDRCLRRWTLAVRFTGSVHTAGFSRGIVATALRKVR